MDGNAKINILNEGISRNGALLMEVINETNLKIMNTDNKCSGKITRQNTKNSEEISAIDFVAVSENVGTWIQAMTIDEEGVAKIKGKKSPSDHNTIIIDLDIKNIDKTQVIKKNPWNIRANDQKWDEFKSEMQKKTLKTGEMLNHTEKAIDEKYKFWMKGIEQSAWKTIGKTTFKEQEKEKFSEEVNKRKQKAPLKNQIQNQPITEERKKLIEQYNNLQEEIKQMIIAERTEKIRQKFLKISQDRSRTSFWKEKRAASRNPALEAIIIKDEKGNRIYGPQQTKKETAKYYRNLYKKKEIEERPFHRDLLRKIKEYEKNKS